MGDCHGGLCNCTRGASTFILVLPTMKPPKVPFIECPTAPPLLAPVYYGSPLPVLSSELSIAGKGCRGILPSDLVSAQILAQ
ncbi:hypothetical protein CRG98_002291, partial [Punica granatum]